MKYFSLLKRCSEYRDRQFRKKRIITKLVMDMFLASILVFTLNFSLAVYITLILCSLYILYSSYTNKFESKARKLYTVSNELWYALNIALLL